MDLRCRHRRGYACVVVVLVLVLILLFVVAMYATRRREKYARFACYGGDDFAVIWSVFWFAMLTKRQAAVVFTAFSASAQSCLRRTQEARGCQRVFVAVVRVRICRDSLGGKSCMAKA